MSTLILENQRTIFYLVKNCETIHTNTIDNLLQWKKKKHTNKQHSDYDNKSCRFFFFKVDWSNIVNKIKTGLLK